MRRKCQFHHLASDSSETAAALLSNVQSSSYSSVTHKTSSSAASRAFAEFCVATEGRAKYWRAKNWPFEMAIYLYMDSNARACAERYFALAGLDIDYRIHIPRELGTIVFVALLLHFGSTVASVFLAARVVSRVVSVMTEIARRRVRRPKYYADETARRRSLAAERLKIRRRSTESLCPTPAQVMAAWGHVRDSKEAMLAFGSILHDLECYVDNELRFNGHGRIIGRNAGVKGWLKSNAPELYRRYTTVMRYKAAAKKLRQIVELRDPIPLSRVLMEGVLTRVLPEESIIRAIAIYHEALDGYVRITPTIARIDELLDPARVNSATMLEHWRKLYEDEIADNGLRNCWRRLRERFRSQLNGVRCRSG